LRILQAKSKPKNGPPNTPVTSRCLSQGIIAGINKDKVQKYSYLLSATEASVSEATNIFGSREECTQNEQVSYIWYYNKSQESLFDNLFTKTVAEFVNMDSQAI